MKSRTCAAKGCKNPLLSTNTIGYCRKHRHMSPDYREYHRIYKNHRYNTDKEFKNRLMAADEKSREKRRKKIREYDRIRAKTPERKSFTRKCKMKRKQIKIEINEKYTTAQEQITRKIFKNKCFLCGSKDILCIDHFRPLSKGFALSLKNAIVLCQKCNCKKHNKMPKDFFSKEQIKLAKELMKKAVEIYNKIKENT